MEITRLSPPTDVRTQLTQETREGLSAEAKRLPTRFLYDAKGSALFEEITQLPEYYLTRSELALLEESALAFMKIARPEEIVELGSGSSRKTCTLIEAMHEVGSGHTYAPLDISEDALLEAETQLKQLYPWLTVIGSVGDLESDIPSLPRRGLRLLVFLGSTIGNLATPESDALLKNVRVSLLAEDRFLLGVDTSRDVQVVEAAYNDSKGVTAAFSLNLLEVLNRELGANFAQDDFEHVARWVPERSSIETFLRARSRVVTTITALESDFVFESGEEIFIERSRKFSRESLDEMTAKAGLDIEHWTACDDGHMALALIAPA